MVDKGSLEVKRGWEGRGGEGGRIGKGISAGPGEAGGEDDDPVAARWVLGGRRRVRHRLQKSTATQLLGVNVVPSGCS